LEEGRRGGEEGEVVYMKIRHAKGINCNRTSSRKCPLFPGQKLEGWCKV
jgi:hypothetical protein